MQSFKVFLLYVSATASDLTLLQGPWYIFGAPSGYTPLRAHLLSRAVGQFRRASPAVQLSYPEPHQREPRQ